jgi:hypothetical protein
MIVGAPVETDRPVGDRAGKAPTSGGENSPRDESRDLRPWVRAAPSVTRLSDPGISGCYHRINPETLMNRANLGKGRLAPKNAP